MSTNQAFMKLKEVVTQPLVLKLPDFSHPPTIKCDANGKGIGAILMQSGQPIAFFSKMLKGRALLLLYINGNLISWEVLYNQDRSADTKISIGTMSRDRSSAQVAQQVDQGMSSR